MHNDPQNSPARIPSSTTSPAVKISSDEALITAAQALPAEHQNQVARLINSWQASSGQAITDGRVAFFIVELWNAGLTDGALEELREWIVYGPASKYGRGITLPDFKPSPEELRAFRGAWTARKAAIDAAYGQGYREGHAAGVNEATNQQLEHERGMADRAERLQVISLAALEESLNFQREALDKRADSLAAQERELRKMARRVGLMLPDAAVPEPKPEPTKEPARPFSSLGEALSSARRA